MTHRLRMIYAKSKTKGTALPKLALWYNDVEKAGYESFKTIAETIQANYDQILNFFNNREGWQRRKTGHGGAICKG